MATVGSAKSTLVNKIDTLTASATAKDSIYLGKALKEVSNLNNFVWKGAWAASTEYALDDVVSESGNSYICIAAHTSAGTFAVGSNWSAMAIKGTDGVNQTDASNITSGTLPNARISGLPVANISGLGTAATKTVGTGAGNVPVLDASGQIADAQIAGLTASKLSGALPAIDGSALTGTSGNLLDIQVLGPHDTVNGLHESTDTSGSSGNWTKPSGCNTIVVYCTGAGGGSSSPSNNYRGGSGAGGGTGIKRYDVSSSGTIPWVTGAGGGGSTTAAGTGGTSSFSGPGGTVSATGGEGGDQNGSTNYCSVGGHGSNGDVNITGSGGSFSHDSNGGVSAGGGSYWGGAGTVPHSGTQASHGNGHWGGGAGWGNNSSGYAGGGGVIVIYCYS